MRLTLEPGPEPEVVAEALHWTTRATDGLSEAVRDRVLLAIGEAVANAVRHGRGPISVSYSRGASSLRIRVADEARELTEGALRRATLPSDRQTTGRGLVLITTLSDRWAVDDGALVLTFETGAG